MSKYYKAEDVIAFLNLHCPKDMWEYQIADLPTIEVSKDKEVELGKMLNGAFKLGFENGIQSVELSEDAISREWVSVNMLKYGFHAPDMTVGEFLADAPSVVPKPKEGKRSRCIWCDSPYRIEYNWIDREGNTASFADEDRHLVATGIANYCPNCGMKMKGDKE